MDYSASIHDGDNPAASPWGSSPVSSPRHARTSSFPTSADGPSSPKPYNSKSVNARYSHDGSIGDGAYNPAESETGTESVADSDDRRPDTAESGQSQPGFGARQQQQQAPVQQQYQAQVHRPEPQRYHGRPHAQQQQPPPTPQYKLQAKITGLERTGRKDPILRFDIHVR